ncbi:MAG: hypothetical protein WC246_00940 [Candidatus Paceibacterota bacterium]|jgi:hypothetical protein
MDLQILQRFNVLCVTKRTEKDRQCFWHIPITGEAEMVVSCTETLGVKVAKTVVRFQGEDHELLYVRSGLSGSAVTLAIKKDDYPYIVWELYTDAPADDESTPEMIRRISQSAISRSRCD